MGTRGSAEDRAREAEDAARILKVSWRQALDIPDGRVENTWENRLKVARVIREQRPQVLILPYWKGRHPDHYTASVLGYEACFIAGLKKLEVGKALSSQDSAFSGQRAAGGERDGAQVSGVRSQGESGTSVDEGQPFPPHRPFKIIYATLYYDVRPTFVVDISDQFEARFESLMAYKTQFSDQEDGKDIFVAQSEIRARVEAMARFYGMLAGVTYGEPFLQKEVGLVDDVMAIPVKSI
jgi:LmbE family N-acetylglucosaminyl deacetylase